jgi:hypothetical protein
MESRNMQIGGDHYRQTDIQPWDVFLDWKLDPWLCNVIKYTQRHNLKNGKQDLEKARHYLNYAIDNYEIIVDRFYKS